ncbi:hypothetical protein VTI28DRAFT_6751 [Corynascus sepedonium]
MHATARPSHSYSTSFANRSSCFEPGRGGLMSGLRLRAARMASFGWPRPMFQVKPILDLRLAQRTAATKFLAKSTTLLPKDTLNLSGLCIVENSNFRARGSLEEAHSRSSAMLATMVGVSATGFLFSVHSHRQLVELARSSRTGSAQHSCANFSLCAVCCPRHHQLQPQPGSPKGASKLSLSTQDLGQRTGYQSASPRHTLPPQNHSARVPIRHRVGNSLAASTAPPRPIRRGTGSRARKPLCSGCKVLHTISAAYIEQSRRGKCEVSGWETRSSSLSCPASVLRPLNLQTYHNAMEPDRPARHGQSSGGMNSQIDMRAARSPNPVAGRQKRTGALLSGRIAFSLLVCAVCAVWP